MKLVYRGEHEDMTNLNNPLLSVTIPVFNMEAYLSRCMDSLLSQQYRNIEIIAVDDGSTDRSLEILNNYAKKDKRIHVIHQENKGLVAARETALKVANGEYISFLDPDDWIDADYYYGLISFMEEECLDIGIGGFVINYDDEQKSIFKRTKKCIYDKKNAMIKMFSFDGYRWELWDKIYRAKVIKTTKVDSKIKCGEDLFRNWFAFSNSERIGYVPLYGYHYYQRVNSMTKKSGIKYNEMVSYVFDELECYAKNKPEIYKSFKIRRLIFVIHECWRLMKDKSDDNNIKKMIAYMIDNIGDYIFLPLRTKALFFVVMINVLIKR